MYKYMINSYFVLIHSFKLYVYLTMVYEQNDYIEPDALI